jgi:hypothetical protein
MGEHGLGGNVGRGIGRICGGGLRGRVRRRCGHRLLGDCRKTAGDYKDAHQGKGQVSSAAFSTAPRAGRPRDSRPEAGATQRGPNFYRLRTRYDVENEIQFHNHRLASQQVSQQCRQSPCVVTIITHERD